MDKPVAASREPLTEPEVVTTAKTRDARKATGAEDHGCLPSGSVGCSTAFVPSAEDWKFLMGDDGTGHCRGCGRLIEVIDPDCAVCMVALCSFMDEDPDFPALMEAARAA